MLAMVLVTLGQRALNVVYLEYIPPITNGTDIPVTISTMAKREKNCVIRVTAKGSGGFTKSVKVNLYPNEIRVETTVPGKLGVVIVSLSNDKFKYEPKQRIVFVSGDSGNPNTSYFQQLNLPNGQLKPSCCTPDTSNLEIGCPASTQTVSLKSTCQWDTTGVGVTRSPGVVFAEGGSVSLPTSIYGIRYRNRGAHTYINSHFISERNYRYCEACENDSDGQCYCYNNFTFVDTLDLLHTRALAHIYIHWRNSEITSVLATNVC